MIKGKKNENFVSLDMVVMLVEMVRKDEAKLSSKFACLKNIKNYPSQEFFQFSN